MRRVLFVLLVLAGVAVPGVAQAHTYRPGCSSSVRKVKVVATNYHLQVATMHWRQTRCWNRRGMLRSSSMDAWFSDTSPGSILGVGIDHGSDYVLYDDTGMQQWGQDYAMRACVAHIVLFCGPTMDFRGVVTIIAPALGGWRWSLPFCTTRVCDKRVRFQWA